MDVRHTNTIKIVMIDRLLTRKTPKTRYRNVTNQLSGQTSGNQRLKNFYMCKPS